MESATASGNEPADTVNNLLQSSLESNCTANRFCRQLKSPSDQYQVRKTIHYELNQHSSVRHIQREIHPQTSKLSMKTNTNDKKHPDDTSKRARINNLQSKNKKTKPEMMRQNLEKRTMCQLEQKSRMFYSIQLPT